MEKADECEREEHACAECHAALRKPPLDRICRPEGAEEAKEFKVGGEMLGGMLAVTQARCQIKRQPEQECIPSHFEKEVQDRNDLNSPVGQYFDPRLALRPLSL